MALPQVIIIGRPNVGKSTLWNRLVGKKLALVDDQPGVTRDRRFGEAHMLGLDFTLVDTAGWEDEDEATLPGRMRQQTEASLEGADVALFVIDSRAGLTPLDEEIGALSAAIVGAGGAGRQQGRGQGRGSRGLRILSPWALAIRSRFRPNTGRAWSICSKRCCRC